MVGRRARVALALVALVAITACSSGSKDDSDDAKDSGPAIGGSAVARGPEAWPAPPSDQVGALTEEAGLALEVKETLIHHVHAHLDVFIDGEHRKVPAGIGIVIADPGVRRFDDLAGTSYGGIEGCATPCISPLHTHDASGVVHTESATAEDNTLGQFFTEWDVRLDATCVGDFCTPDTSIEVYVDGKEVPLADAADIPLTDQKEIAIVIGDPPDRIPSEGDFSGA
jgi:hypothetical protein